MLLPCISALTEIIISSMTVINKFCLAVQDSKIFSENNFLKTSHAKFAQWKTAFTDYTACLLQVFTYLLYLLLWPQCFVINTERFLLRLPALHVTQPVLKRFQTFAKFSASQQSNVQLTFSLSQLTNAHHKHIHSARTHTGIRAYLYSVNLINCWTVLPGVITRSYAITKRTARRSCLVDLLHCQHCFL